MQADRSLNRRALALVGIVLLICVTAGCGVIRGIQTRIALERQCNVPREGHCAAVQVNGQTTVPMSERTRALLTETGWDEWIRRQNCAMAYEVPQAVQGAIEVDAEWKPDAVEHFGSPATSRVLVKPLDAQVIETSQQLQSSPSVRVNGSAAVTYADVVRDNRLPSGAYLFQIRLYGAKSDWDCQGVFVRIVD